ncbi:MAG: LacI family transcriptional regulator [Oscillospiraceae bacterium]|nr:LacI family transcriptional regulator [Oscillospiraceae bacterium]
MAVTIKDVAREAGVSFSTVSKVVNNSPFISEATTIRVKEVIERMNYTPNVRAASFKRRSTHNIAFLTVLSKGVAFDNPHMFEILCGVHGALARKGYNATLVDVSGDNKPGDTVRATISSGAYDGLIAHGTAINRAAAAMLVRESFPHVVLGKQEIESQMCWLDTNNVLAGDIAAHHLLEGGARRVAFIGGGREEGVSKARLDGVRSATKELGMTVREDNIRYTDSSIEESYSAALELLTKQDRPEAIVCSNNLVAIGTLKAVHEMKLSMPDDLQVITFDDYPFSRIMNPSPTVVTIDFYELGEQMASQLLRNIKNPALRVQSYITLPELIIRGTTKKVD